VNLRKDHSHTSNHFTVNFYVNSCMGGVASAAPAVHWFAGSGAALGFTSAAKLSLFVYNTIVSQLFLLVVSFGQLSATDVSARTTMKGAAKCDKHCELQNSVNQ
jgi:hypothetical protein